MGFPVGFQISSGTKKGEEIAHAGNHGSDSRKRGLSLCHAQHTTGLNLKSSFIELGVTLQEFAENFTPILRRIVSIF